MLPREAGTGIAHAQAQWRLFLAGNKERSVAEGMARHWFKMLNRKDELYDVYVNEAYLPIQIMSTLVVLLTLAEDDVFPETEEDEEDEDDREHRALFGF